MLTTLWSSSTSKPLLPTSSWCMPGGTSRGARRSRERIADSTTTCDPAPPVTVILPDIRWTLTVAACDGFDNGTVTLSCALTSAGHAINHELINHELTRIVYIFFPLFLN